MADIKLIDAQGDERTYSGVAKVKIPLADGTGNATFIQPAGKKELTGTNEVDVTNFATAQVVDKNLIAENIKSGVSILGVEGTHEGGGSGECSGEHIIEVDELPTVNIDEGAVYKQNFPFYDTILSFYGVSSMGMNGVVVATKPTENIKVSDLNNNLIYLYCVEDENDIFFYTDAWYSLGEVAFEGAVTFKGFINDESEATEEGYYCLSKSKYYKYSNGDWQLMMNVIECDELPTENIKENILYVKEGRYYEYYVESWRELQKVMCTLGESRTFNETITPYTEKFHNSCTAFIFQMNGKKYVGCLAPEIQDGKNSLYIQYYDYENDTNTFVAAYDGNNNTWVINRTVTMLNSVHTVSESDLNYWSHISTANY